MARVIVHATVTLDGFMADEHRGVDWMFDFPSAPEDEAVVQRVMDEIGAIVGVANRTQTIEDGEIPYGGMLKVPVFLMTRRAHEPVERDGITYTFVVDDIARALESAKEAAGDRWVSLLGGSISRQCLERGLVDELHLDVVPILLGGGARLFEGVGPDVKLEQIRAIEAPGVTHVKYRVRRASS